MRRLTHQEYADLDELTGNLLAAGYNPDRREGEHPREQLDRLRSIAAIQDARERIKQPEPDTATTAAPI
jgi:DnaJ-domain-containing protein 1